MMMTMIHPFSGAPEQQDLSPKSKIVVAAALCFANSPPFETREFPVYMEGYVEDLAGVGLRGPKEGIPRGQGIWPRGGTPFGPRVAPRLHLVLIPLLFHKKLRGFRPL